MIVQILLKPVGKDPEGLDGKLRKRRIFPLFIIGSVNEIAGKQEADRERQQRCKKRDTKKLCLHKSSFRPLPTEKPMELHGSFLSLLSKTKINKRIVRITDQPHHAKKQQSKHQHRLPCFRDFSAIQKRLEFRKPHLQKSR